MNQALIVWYGQGGELETRVVTIINDLTLSRALADMVLSGVVTPGDSFVVTPLD